jgi:hypothetical protein
MVLLGAIAAAVKTQSMQLPLASIQAITAPFRPLPWPNVRSKFLFDPVYL